MGSDGPEDENESKYEEEYVEKNRKEEKWTSARLSLLFAVRPKRKRKTLFGRVNIDSQLNTNVTNNKIPEIPIPGLTHPRRQLLSL